MPTIYTYRRDLAAFYAEQWALSRNPLYYDYTDLGGDCTNFVSQCLFAGSGIMDFTPTFGWYYIDANQKSPAWTGVEFFYNFLTTNRSRGIFGSEVPRTGLRIGDVIQLKKEGRYYHSLFVLAVQDDEIYVAAHDDNALYRPLSSYPETEHRFLHIEGYYGCE